MSKSAQNITKKKTSAPKKSTKTVAKKTKEVFRPNLVQFLTALAAASVLAMFMVMMDWL